MFDFLKKRRELQRYADEYPEIMYHAGLIIRLVRKRHMRGLKLHLKVSGQITLTVPTKATQAEMLAFLTLNEAWMLKKSQAFLEYRLKNPAKSFSEGERFYYLGSPRTLRFAPTPGARARIDCQQSELYCYIPEVLWESFCLRAEHPEVLKGIASFYERRGRKILTERFSYLSTVTGLTAKRLTLRSQKTRWGSCSSTGTISLNWRLVFAPPEVMDYVIVHELVHLKHPNHSARFWSEVERFDSNYKKHRAWLRTHQSEADFLGQHKY